MPFLMCDPVDVYNDIRRLKLTVSRADPVDFVEEGRRLLQEIKKFD